MFIRRSAIIAFASLLVAGALAADSGWLGRVVTYVATTVDVTANISVPARVASVSIVYSTPASGSVTVTAVQSGVSYLRMTNAFTSARSVVFVPEELWLRTKNGDKLVVTSSAGVQGTVVVDFVD